MSRSKGRESGSLNSFIGMVCCGLLVLTVFEEFFLMQVTHADTQVLTRSRYFSARGVALGGAFLPLGDDIASGLFWNPAVLGKIRKPEFEFWNVSFDGNQNYFSLVDAHFYQVIDLKNWAPILQRVPNTLSQVGGAFFPNFGFPLGSFNLGCGLLIQSRWMAESEGANSLTYQSLYQWIPAVGIGFQAFKSFLRMGYSLQWVNQASGKQTVDTTLNPVSYALGLGKGSALSHQLGIAFSIPSPWMPSFNFVLRNIGGAHFQSGGWMPFSVISNTLPPDEPMTLDASWNASSRVGKGLRATVVIGYSDITHPTFNVLSHQMALGLEFGYRETFFVRTGWQNGYLSAGIGLKKPTASLSLSFATESIPNWNQTDTRFLFQYQMKAI